MLTFLLIIFMVTLVVLTSGLAIQEWRREGSDEEPGDVPVETAPESLEGVLVRQLIDHEIDARQYHRAMHRLADRDALRNPLPGLPGQVPPG